MEQLGFTFARDEQDELIDRARDRLAATLTNTKANNLRALLRAIVRSPRSDRGEIPQDVLAYQTGVSVRTLRSVLEIAQLVGLVTVTRADGMRRPCGYAIDWDRVRSIGRGELRSANFAERSANRVAERSATFPPTPPSPLLNLNPPTPKPCATVGPEWSAAAEVLRKAGAPNADELVRIASTAGRPVADLHRAAAVISHERNRGTFTKPGGAVRYWLERGTWPSDRVFDPIAAAASDVRQDERRRVAAAEDAERREQLAAEREALEQLEQRRGGELDELADDERRNLAAEAFGRGTPLWAVFVGGGWRERGGVVRAELLELLDQAATVADP